MDAKEFCTCQNLKCKLHPKNHQLGCTPCMEKNLQTDDIPNCLFNKIDPTHKRQSTKPVEYAKLVLNKE